VEKVKRNLNDEGLGVHRRQRTWQVISDVIIDNKFNQKNHLANIASQLEKDMSYRNVFENFTYGTKLETKDEIYVPSKVLYPQIESLLK